MPAESATPTTTQPLSAEQKALRKLGLRRPIDLALHLPLRYEDETSLVALAEVAQRPMAGTVQFEATVIHQDVVFHGRRQLLVTVEDGGERCLLRFFNFYPSQKTQMALGKRLRIRGELRGGFGGLTMMHPAVHVAGGTLPQALTPMYPSTTGLSQIRLRKKVLAGLQAADVSETIHLEALQTLPVAVWPLAQALQFLHQPPPDQTLAVLQDMHHPAWQRLKAEELLAQQLSQIQARRERQRLGAPVLQAGRGGLHEQLLASLPFQLTGAQRRVGAEIAADLARSQPMNRLLQGDVGSGKTVVAALAACIAIDSGWQCVLMAPTEILARQHFATLIDWLAPLLAARGQHVAWLVGRQKKKERQDMLDAVADGTAALVIGTHAVIGEQVKFARLGLAIIDEQHRFGVEQRLHLRQQHGDQTTEPHLLMMSATPIPRTLAMSYYADLDVSTIDELPPGRTPVLTRLLPEHRRPELIERLRVQMQQGHQAYWVCPLIEESEALDLRHATQTHEELTADLPGVKVGLLHARLPSAEKKAVMARFLAGEIGLLVSTTVIEVGVDVPSASLMVIENAERFGLSQLHQLRGRVGRGAAQSACMLLYSQPEGGRLSETTRARLTAMRETTDGFEIARRDLHIRGPGEFLGARQSGAALLRFADLTEDDGLLQWAQRVAPSMLIEHPESVQRHIQRWLGGRLDYLKA